MNGSKKLEAGEKYLSISILKSINVAAFKNQNKKNPTDPDYMGNGIAVWVKEKKADIKTESI